MKPLFIDNPIEVSNELERLGLLEEGLRGAVDAVVLARNNCTPNDVPAARGLKGWLDGTRYLRDFYCRRGWEKNEDGHISSLFHREKQIKVMILNSDDATGLKLEDRQPQNRSRKGPATDRAVSMNCHQMTMWDVFDIPNVIQLDGHPSGLQHWFLCVFCEGDFVRAEISLPAKCEGGFFTSFLKRIILIGETDNDDGSGIRVRPDGPEGDSDFEIPVIRKQA
jgi:hypothetical protein